MKYKANRDTWLSHECRMVKAGETFETTFPPIKDKKGNVIGEMALSDNLELVKEEDEKPAKKAEKAEKKAADLV